MRRGRRFQQGWKRAGGRLGWLWRNAREAEHDGRGKSSDGEAPGRGKAQAGRRDANSATVHTARIAPARAQGIQMGRTSPSAGLGTSSQAANPAAPGRASSRANRRPGTYGALGDQAEEQGRTCRPDQPVQVIGFVPGERQNGDFAAGVAGREACRQRHGRGRERRRGGQR